MTAEESILQLKVWIKANERDLPIRVKDAMKLGIEALKRHKEIKAQVCWDVYWFAQPLPGETEKYGGKG